jgi:hypothetical protein
MNELDRRAVRDGTRNQVFFNGAALEPRPSLLVFSRFQAFPRVDPYRQDFDFDFF